MSFNKEHFENESIWNYSVFQRQMNEEKFAYIQSKIDLSSISSIIDIGCGNGDMLKHFSGLGVSLHGADFSEIALSEASSHARVTYLDFEKVNMDVFDSYDLVMTFDVLEHLRDIPLKNAIDLISSISRKYVVVNVPNNEDLEMRRAKCYNCKTIFHPYGHINSFDERELSDIFKSKGFKLLYTKKLGPVKPYTNFYVSNMSKCLFNNFMDVKTAHCPACGKCKLISKVSFVIRALNMINKIIGFFHKREREELMLIFERK